MKFLVDNALSPVVSELLRRVEVLRPERAAHERDKYAEAIEAPAYCRLAGGG